MLTLWATSVAINQGVTEMTKLKLRLVSFGSAKALTRDGLGIQFMEGAVRNGLYPTGG